MSVEIGESTQVGEKEWTATYSNGGLVCGTAQANMANWNGVILDSPSPYYAPPYSMDDPGTIPDSLCPNCRRDRHDYPLTVTVAEMWKSLSFDEDYDPASDVSRIVCPGSDVCGPVVDTSTRATPGWYSTTVSQVFSVGDMAKYWESAKFDIESFKVNPWTADYAPISLESDGESPIWTLSTVNDLKCGFTSKELTFPDMKDVVADDLYAFAPVSQAAIEAAPKQIEHEAPQPAGFDFTNIKTAYPTYPTGKKNKK